MRTVRRYGPRLLIGTAASVAFLWLFLREVDLGAAWQDIRALPFWAIAGALACVLANLVLMTVRWHYLLEGAGYRLPARSLFSTVCVGRAVNNVIPARGGDLVRIESMREIAQVPVFVSAGTLFAERLLDGVVFAIWILLGAVAVGGGGIPLLTGIALSSGAALGCVLVVLAARNPDGAERFVWRVTRPLPPRWHTRVTRAAAHFVDGLGAFRSRRRLGLVFGGSVLMWLADVAMFALVGHAFGLELEWGAYFLVEGIGNLALAVPATAAGLGSFDYITLLAAKHVQIDEQTATAYVLTMHALIVIPVTVAGAFFIRPALPRLFRSRTAS
jgi:uncharacterized protein (TIRG00374 family)